jgi:hypothetical protein
MIGPDGLRLGEANWHERAKDQRLSVKVRSHGYPLGLAKSNRMTREHLLADLQERLEQLSPAAYARHRAAHEALAWALDAERFLGSFHAGQLNVERVDAVTDHLLVWLAERGFQIVPTNASLEGDASDGQ